MQYASGLGCDALDGDVGNVHPIAVDILPEDGFFAITGSGIGDKP